MLKCPQMGAIAAPALGGKEVAPRLVRMVAKDIVNMSNTCIVVKIDNGPDMKALAGHAQEMSHPAVVGEPLEYEPLEYEPLSSGLAERCMQTGVDS